MNDQFEVRKGQKEQRAEGCPPLADPRLVSIFHSLGESTGVLFCAASMGDQLLATTPGGPSMPDGASLLQGRAGAARSSVETALLSGMVAQTTRHDGAPVLCAKFVLRDDVVGVLECGFTNQVRPELPSFDMAIASEKGFSMQQIEKLIGHANPTWAMLMAGGRDVTFLKKPSARLRISPQSLDECRAMLLSLREIFPAEPLSFPPRSLCEEGGGPV